MDVKKKIEYQKPGLREYSYFGVVVDGTTAPPGDQGDERSEATCNISGLDE